MYNDVKTTRLKKELLLLITCTAVLITTINDIHGKC